MTTLNARANQAWIDARDPDTGFSPFSHQRHAFEEGWETGYKAKAAELPTQEEIAKALHDHWSYTHTWRQGCHEEVCIVIFLDRAAAVMALLEGSPS